MSLAAEAAILRAPRAPVEVAPIELEEPGPGEVLVRLEACGLCHSDLMIAGLDRLPLAPLVLGHEGIGHVERTGQGVDQVVAGDRVGLTFLASTCGACEYCATGRERYCARQVNFGYTRHGSMAQCAVAPAASLVRVPAELPAHVAAPLCCAGWTALSAVRQAKLNAGQTLAVYGAGGLGHLGIQYARAAGLRVLAADVSEEKLALARQVGADVAMISAESGRKISKELGGADAAVVFVPSPEAVAEAFRALKRTGTLVVAGLSTRPWEMPLYEAVLKGITFHGSYLGSREELEEVFRLAVAGVGIPRVETHPLSGLPGVMESMKLGRLAGRAVVVF
jgi:propanol-preferring alcohol dehydrogenase